MASTALLSDVVRGARAALGWVVPGVGLPRDRRQSARARRFRDVVGRRRAEAAGGSDLVHRALERWVDGHLGTISHEQRVVALATDLFRVTSSLHGLSARDLRLLRWAALVHDVGRSVRDETHPDDGADLILADRSLPLTTTERRQLAYLTRYHRDKVPAAGLDAVLSPADDADRLLRVLALLRAADGLDNRSLGRRSQAPPRVVFALDRRESRPARLRIDCYLSEESGKARRVYTRRKKYRLIETVLNCEVVPNVVHLRNREKARVG